MQLINQVKEITALIKKLGSVDLYCKIVNLQAEINWLVHHNHYLTERLSELEKARSTNELRALPNECMQRNTDD